MIAAFPFLRRPEALQQREFDLLVIGGGIYGAWTAYDAALRGLSVALVERDDWGSGASSATSKLIHGGLGYLEYYELGQVRQALAERRRLYRLAPHLVRPQGFVLPVWQGPRASQFLISVGLTLYDLMAFGKQPVPRHRHYRAPALLTDFPFLDPRGLLGGFRYGDCQEDDARMTLVVAAAAQAAGAVCVNHMAAEQLLEDEVGVRGALLRDGVTQQAFELCAKVVVNATGAWAPELPGATAPPLRLVKGTHLLLPPIPNCDEAFLLTARDGRLFFVLPWYGRTLVGTTEQVVSDPGQVQPTPEETRYLLEGLRNGLPGLGWTEKDVIASFAGVRAQLHEDYHNVSAVPRGFEVLQLRPWLLGYVGSKYTTARCDSEQLVDAVFRALGRYPPPSRSDAQPLPGAPSSPFELWLPQAIAQLTARGVDEEAARWLSLRHGSGIELLMQRMAERPELRARVHPDLPFLMVEVVHALESEMARTLDDVIRRRLPLSLLVRDGDWREKVETLIARRRS